MELQQPAKDAAAKSLMRHLHRGPQQLLCHEAARAPWASRMFNPRNVDPGLINPWGCPWFSWGFITFGGEHPHINEQGLIQQLLPGQTVCEDHCEPKPGARSKPISLPDRSCNRLVLGRTPPQTACPGEVNDRMPCSRRQWTLGFEGFRCDLEQRKLPSTSGQTAHVTWFQWAARNAVKFPKQSCHDLLHHVVGMGRGHRLLHVALELAGQLARLLLARALQGQLHQAAARLVARQVPNVALQSLTCMGTRSAKKQQPPNHRQLLIHRASSSQGLCYLLPISLQLPLEPFMGMLRKEICRWIAHQARCDRTWLPTSGLCRRLSPLPVVKLLKDFGGSDGSATPNTCNRCSLSDRLVRNV